MKSIEAMSPVQSRNPIRSQSASLAASMAGSVAPMSTLLNDGIQGDSEGTDQVSGLEFIDFEPASGFMSRALEKLGRVVGESPSDSSAKASLRKTGHGFVGHLRINSAVGSFVADVVGEDPLDVIGSLALKVRTQLRVWRRNRSFELGF